MVHLCIVSMCSCLYMALICGPSISSFSVFLPIYASDLWSIYVWFLFVSAHIWLWFVVHLCLVSLCFCLCIALLCGQSMSSFSVFLPIMALICGPFMYNFSVFLPIYGFDLWSQLRDARRPWNFAPQFVYIKQFLNLDLRPCLTTCRSWFRYSLDPDPKKQQKASVFYDIFKPKI